MKKILLIVVSLSINELLAETLPEYCKINIQDVQQNINYIRASKVLLSNDEQECLKIESSCSFNFVSKNEKYFQFSFEDYKISLVSNSMNNVRVSNRLCSLSFTSNLNMPLLLMDQMFHSSVSILDNSGISIATVSSTLFRPYKIPKGPFSPKDVLEVTLPENVISYDFNKPFACQFKIPGRDYSQKYSALCSGFLETNILGIENLIKTQHNWNKNLGLFRKNLVDGSQTNCGMVIDVKNNIAQIQYNYNSDNKAWIEKSKLFPPVDEYGYPILCRQ
jgi:hypothetical protein